MRVPGSSMLSAKVKQPLLVYREKEGASGKFKKSCRSGIADKRRTPIDPVSCFFSRVKVLDSFEDKARALVGPCRVKILIREWMRKCTRRKPSERRRGTQAAEPGDTHPHEVVIKDCKPAGVEAVRHLHGRKRLRDPPRVSSVLKR